MYNLLDPNLLSCLTFTRTLVQAVRTIRRNYFIGRVYDCDASSLLHWTEKAKISLDLSGYTLVYMCDIEIVVKLEMVSFMQVKVVSVSWRWQTVSWSGRRARQVRRLCYQVIDYGGNVCMNMLWRWRRRVWSTNVSTPRHVEISNCGYLDDMFVELYFNTSVFDFIIS